MKKYIPELLFVENRVKDHPETLRMLRKLEGIEKIFVNDENECLSFFQGSREENFTRGKRALYFTRHMGDFFKPCPCTRKYMCCGYNFINLVTNCNFDCTYCIMQSYLNFPLMRIHVNIEDFFQEMDGVFKRFPDHFFRCGTGELTDSLSIDHITEHGKKLSEYFSTKKNAILELKTKSNNIDGVLEANHNGRTVMSWSMNTKKISESDEKDSNSLKERLEAAALCEKKGFKLSFHFDPIIIYEGCVEEYKKSIDMIFDYVSGKNIAWISMGSLRFMSDLKNIVKLRFPQSKIMYGEFIRGDDGKSRYFKKLRIDVYRELYDYFMKKDSSLLVYLCMESLDVCEKVIGKRMSSKELQQKMDERVR